MSVSERTYKTRAIVLRARNLAEADRIYTLFTESRGKLDAVGKGVRRTKSQLAGRLEFMSEVMLVLHRGRNLDVITSAELVATHWPRLVRPEAFATANLFAELLDAFCEPDLAVPEAYALLRGAMRALADSADPERPTTSVVGRRIRVVPGGGDDVESRPVLPTVCGALEPTDKKAAKKLGHADLNEYTNRDPRRRRPGPRARNTRSPARGPAGYRRGPAARLTKVYLLAHRSSCAGGVSDGKVAGVGWMRSWHRAILSLSGGSRLSGHLMSPPARCLQSVSRGRDAT